MAREAPTDGARVLVLHTGGTIGMREGPRGYEPAPGFLRALVATMPQLSDTTAPRHGHDFVTPPFVNGRRAYYDFVDYDPLLDSANLDLSDWARFADDLAAHMDAYDAFVLLHGTDTMAFTASALSFALEGLKKTVVLTGSQAPLFVLRSDGLDNVLGALRVATEAVIPEVTLFFHDRLYRGNRATKSDAVGLAAFASPNAPALADVTTHVLLREELILPAEPRPFRARTQFSPNVAALRLYPGITREILGNFVRPPLAGLVLETYGAGNAPDTRRDLLDVLEAAIDRGLLVLNVTQCLRGTVSGAYAAGHALAQAGVIPGADLTAEAALAKMAYVLGLGVSPDEARRLLATPLRGEMTL
jgi:lysophospholipase